MLCRMQDETKSVVASDSNYGIKCKKLIMQRLKTIKFKKIIVNISLLI